MSSANTPFEPNNLPPNAASQPPSATALSCDEVAALMPAHSIGATDPDEAVAINLQLGNCAAATVELAAYGKVAELLLYAVNPQPAPARLADKLRAATGVASSPPYRSAMPPVAPRRTTGKRKKPSPFMLVPLPPPKPRRQWSWGRPLIAAASVLLVAVNLTLLVENQQLRTRQEQLAAELDRQNRALIFLAAEEPQEVILPAAQENSEAQADVLWNSSLGVAVVYVRAFPELPPDMAYQLWLRKGEERTSAGIFTVDNTGMGILVFPITESLDTYDLMGITPEPAGGSPGPTAPAVVRGPV